jgi:hypothetical protein
MVDIIKMKFPGFNKLTSGMQDKKKWGYFDALLLVLLFALAFCPHSGVLYFGMLVTLAVSSASGLYLPIIFAVATGIPVIIIAWVLAHTFSGIGNVYNRIKSFELLFRRIIAVMFIAVGINYIIRVYL